MSQSYNPKEIEKKWQKVWEDEKAFQATNDFSKPKYYALVEFPYPSGQGLHVGHPRPYTALDIVARKRRMQGYNVLYPMGWDAFGLPTENYAIKNKVHPKEVTKKNVARFKAQLQALGYSFDWDREINTTDPNYYKWTQWIFLKLFKAGLAYKTEMPINWCTSCKCGLANEEVVNGVCERCGSPVIRKVKSQWMLKITAYADKLIDDLDGLDYIERVKVSQKNWIGRSHGAEVDFQIKDKEEKLRIYTTRPDTLFGVTYMVVSPEHPYLDKYKDEIKNWDEIVAYREMAARKSDFERTELAKDKTGVAIDGLLAINPVNGEEIPIWVSDYVLMSYGTGAIMAVPAHDTRDWEFAKKFNLPIHEVIEGGDVEKEAFTDVATGTLVNSGFLTGKSVEEAKKEAEASKDEAEEAKTEEVSEEQEAGTEDQTEEKASKKFFGKKDKKDKKDEKIEELTDRLTRQMAEFDNFRKRTEKEKSQMYEVGAKDIIEKILPVVDNFERGLDAVKEEDKEDPFVQGMEKVYKHLLTTLEGIEVKPIEAVGQPFDPNFHNAVMHVEDENFGENIVAEEFQKGYTYRDSVVRHSMVKVAN